MGKTKRRRKTKKKQSKQSKRRKSIKQNIIRQRRHPTRIIFQQARHRDQKGRHYQWLLSLGAKTRWDPRSIGKFSVGNLSSLMGQLSVKKRKSVKKRTKK